MQPFQCDLAPQRQETHRTTHTGTNIGAKHIEGTKRPQPQPSHRRSSFHRRLQPLYTEQNTRFRAPASSPHHTACNIMQPFQCDLAPQRQETHRTTHTGTSIVAKHIEGTKRPQPQPPHKRGSFHRHHFPSSPLPFVTTSHRHHFPSSPLPIVTTSLRHHFPSSPLPFVTTSHRHHFPLSPLPIVTTSLRHHFPSSPLPFVTTRHYHHPSLRHHFPSSPLPFVTTRHYHHPSLRHHFPSSPLPFVTTSLRHHPSLSPPFIKVNSTASYSFVMYCIVMLCIVM